MGPATLWLMVLHGSRTHIYAGGHYAPLGIAMLIPHSVNISQRFHMIKSIFASFRFVALCALTASIPLASPVFAQKSAVEEAVEAATDAAEAAFAEPAGVAIATPPRRNSEAIKKAEKERKEREVAVKAAFEFTPSPALWKMSDDDSTVYIFAGIRGFTSQIKWQSDAFKGALKSADKIYFETAHYDRGDREARRQNERKAFRKLIRHDRDLVEERFAPGLFAQIKEDLNRNFLSIGDFMPTWLLIALIADTDRMFQPGRVNRDLDFKITQAVTDRDLKISGLEEPTHLLDLLNDIDEKTQRKWLNAFARAELAVDPSERYKQRKRGPFGRVEPLTAQENLGIIWAKGQPPEAAAVKPEGLSDMYELIREDRMKNWPVKIGAMLDDEGTSLVVVDQEYLYGDDNLRTALQKKGFELERVR